MHTIWFGSSIVSVSYVNMLFKYFVDTYKLFDKIIQRIIHKTHKVNLFDDVSRLIVLISAIGNLYLLGIKSIP